VKRKPRQPASQPHFHQHPTGAATSWLDPQNLALAAILAIVTLLLYWPATGFDFTNYDDPRYVTNNPHVLGGLTWGNVGWAFTTDAAGNWHPLTWISLMLGAQFFGPGAGGQHTLNIMLHAANTALLFFVLRRFTGAFWRSGCVAALFAWHPLHVESVAWIAERKDVLSTFFAWLMLYAYGAYAGNPKNFWLSRNYWLVFLFFALGLMSKPMLVTMPLVLWLLDFWPLRRWETSGVNRSQGVTAFINQDAMDSRQSSAFWSLLRPGTGALLVVEKIPFLLLALVSGVITLIVQSRGGNVQTLANFPLADRIENAFVAYARYLGKTVWPENLAVYYPHPGHWPWWQLFAAVILTGGLSFVLLWLRRRLPYAVTGWFWFLVMLLPVIGVVQVGDQSMADRYTYLPLTGVFIGFVWGADEFLRRWRVPKPAVGFLMVAILAALAVRTTDQLRCWHDSEILMRHAIAVTGPNYLAENNLGDALLKNGDVAGAIPHFRAALDIQPGCVTAWDNLGEVALKGGQMDDALSDFTKSVNIDPGDVPAQNNLGGILLQKGQFEPAIAHYQQALAAEPGSPKLHRNLAIALAQAGRLDEASQHFQAAVNIQPDDADTQNNLASALLQQGRLAEAAAHYQKALELDPSSSVIQNNLARIVWILATAPDPKTRNGAQAIELAQQTDRLSGGKNPAVIGALAAGYAETGKFPEAVTVVQLALQMATNSEDGDLRGMLQGQLKAYAAGEAFRQEDTNSAAVTPEHFK